MMHEHLRPGQLLQCKTIALRLWTTLANITGNGYCLFEERWFHNEEYGFNKRYWMLLEFKRTSSGNFVHIVEPISGKSGWTAKLSNLEIV